MLSVTGSTRLAGVIGWPIKHTLSPAMHNAAFAHLGLDAVYLPLGVPGTALQPLIATLQSLNALGANVTIPYKEKVIPFLSGLSEGAEKIGAVNTLVFEKDRILGHNTDAMGFIMSLEGQIQLPGKRVVLLGGGGGGRAVAYALLQAGVGSLTIMDLDQGRIEKLAADFRQVGAGTIQTAAPGAETLKTALAQADLVVNATPLGLKPGDPLPVQESWMPAGRCAMDLVYGHGDTPFMTAARKKENRVVPGWQMLLNQGVAAFQLWTRMDPPVAVMKQALLEAGGLKE
jgi:shikimate dehydrogenase